MGGNPLDGNGAYANEMNEAALFMDALRAAVPTQPDPRLAVTLVPRLASTARTATIEAETRQTRRAAPAARAARRPRSRRALVARVGIAVALIPLVLAGLAVAGVTVPAPARSAFDSVGIHLPNQPKDKAEGGTSAPSSQPPAHESGAGGAQGGDTEATEPEPATKQGKGKEKAKDKSKAKGQDKGIAQNQGRGKAVGRNDLVPPGHSGQMGPPPHSNTGGNGQGASNKRPKASKGPKSTHAPKGVAKGHTKIPPGQAKK